MTEHDTPRDTGNDPYETLGVGAQATDAEITTAYRRLARDHHPDTNPEADDSAFADLTDAYDVLRDPQRRRAHDNTRRARSDAAAAAGIRIPVNRRASGADKGRPTTTEARPRQARPIEIVLSFDQAALGTTIRVPVPASSHCSTCAGTGATDHDARCEPCAGAGATVRTSGGITIRNTCATCGGTGRPPPRPCPACGGSGRTLSSHDVQVRVPAGVEDGHTLDLPVGDAVEAHRAVVRVQPHPYFGRRGDDLTVRLPITLAEAALGAVVSVPTLTGAVAIRVPPGTTHGRILRVRGRGIPGGDRPGDLLATIDLVIPAELSDQQRRALEAFAAATESPRRHYES